MASHLIFNLFLTRGGALGVPFLILHLLLLQALLVHKAYGNTVVSGTVFCDQCKDGQRSLFDYPLSGIKVVVACTNSNGQVTMSKQDTTNFFGSYAISFDGNPDLTTGCHAQISSNPGTGQGTSPSSCAASAGPAQRLKRMFNIFNTAVYTVDSLLSQPAKPMPFCPQSAPPLRPPPVLVPIQPAPRLPPPTNTPPARLPPPAVQFPPLSPFIQPSACPSQTWMMPEYKCYWKVVGPHTRVAVAFGLIAAQRYGTNMTLMEGLGGRGSLYAALLREGTTALLNSYNSVGFSYPTPVVLGYMNWALISPPRQSLQMAYAFKRANSGSARVPCNFTPCK